MQYLGFHLDLFDSTLFQNVWMIFVWIWVVFDFNLVIQIKYEKLTNPLKPSRAETHQTSTARPPIRSARVGPLTSPFPSPRPALPKPPLSSTDAERWGLTEVHQGTAQPSSYIPIGYLLDRTTLHDYLTDRHLAGRRKVPLRIRIKAG